MKKRGAKDFYILVAVLAVILLGFLLFNFLQELPVLIPEQREQRIGELLSPVLQETYFPPLSLQNTSFYQNGFIPSEPLRRYMRAFTNDNDFTDTYQHLIQFQQGLNGVSLNSALKIDKALAKSLVTAAEEVRRAGEKNEENENDKEACSYFNSLLNPSLLALDLTLWNKQSQLFPVLQEYRDVGIQCLKYFEVLNHGLFSYDPRTGKMLQKSVFCTPEERSICYNSWAYFWKFATDRKEASANLGACSFMADWMMQGFVCINGIDLEKNMLVQTLLLSKKIQRFHLNRLPPEEHLWITVSELGSPSPVKGMDVKDSFQNALGAGGKTVIDNVKRKCAQVKEKTNKYTSLVPALTGPSLTGSVVSAEIISSSAEELQEEYEKAMLFASLFSEACMQNPKDFIADLGSGAVGSGLNNAKACLLDGVSGSNSKVKCIDAFKPSRRLDTGSTTGSTAPSADHPGKGGVPDPKCKLSKSASGAPREVLESLTPPSPMERTYYNRLGGNRDFRVVDPYVFSSLCDICDPSKVKAFTPIAVTVDENGNTVDAEQDGPIIYQEGYQQEEVVKHEEWHAACPQCTHEQIKDLIDNKVNPPATGTMTPAQTGEKCGKKCDTFKSTDQQPKNDQAGQPEDPESDNCSAQAQRLETFSNCIDEKEGAQKVTVKEGSTDPLGPDSEMYGGSARTCGQVAAGGGGYFGVKQGAIDCEQSQQAYGCDFIGIVYISSTQGLFSKKCQQVQGSGENNLGLQCPSISG